MNKLSQLIPVDRNTYKTYKVKDHHLVIPERYNIDGIETVSWGEYGIFIDGIDTENGNNKVVIRKVQNPLRLTDFFIRLMYRGFRILQEISYHENIINLYDSFSDIEIIEKGKDGKTLRSVYFVTKKMDFDLKELLSKNKQQLKEDEFKYIIYSLLLATKKLHSLNLVHLWIKPSSILVNSDWDIVLKDFERCRAVGSNSKENDEDYTYGGFKNHYQSPENLCGYEINTQKNDVWSIGCILGELVSRRRLFDSRNVLKHIEFILDFLENEPCLEDGVFKGSKGAKKYITKYLVERKRSSISGFEKLKSENEKISPECWDLLEKMLKYDPDERLSAREALEHPFFEQLYDKDEDDDDKMYGRRERNENDENNLIYPWVKNEKSSSSSSKFDMKFEFVKEIELFHKFQNKRIGKVFDGDEKERLEFVFLMDRNDDDVNTISEEKDNERVVERIRITLSTNSDFDILVFKSLCV